MRVKIGDTWYDSDKEPMVLVVTAREANTIAMLREYPDGGRTTFYPPNTPYSIQRLLDRGWALDDRSLPY